MRLQIALVRKELLDMRSIADTSSTANEQPVLFGHMREFMSCGDMKGSSSTYCIST